ncbi:hypothetical protein FRB94_005466, partial [Tulasnella sp. JGI-2019a]
MSLQATIPSNDPTEDEQRTWRDFNTMGSTDATDLVSPSLLSTTSFSYTPTSLARDGDLFALLNDAFSRHAVSTCPISPTFKPSNALGLTIDASNEQNGFEFYDARSHRRMTNDSESLPHKDASNSLQQTLGQLPK